MGVAHRLAYAGVEIWAEHLWERGERPQRLRSLAKRHGLTISVHGPICEVNVTSRNPGIRRESRRQYGRALDDAVELGASVVVLHPGSLSPGHEATDGYWDALVEYLNALGEAAAQRGVKVGVEHMEKRPREYVTSPCHVVRLLRTVASPSLGLTLDIAHLLFSGQTANLAALAPHVVGVHISGSTRTQPHVPLREGIYDLRPSLRALSTFYDGVVVIEGRVPGREMETVQSNRQAFDELCRAARQSG